MRRRNGKLALNLPGQYGSHGGCLPLPEGEAEVKQPQ
jgi:hypothetical protein